MLESNLIKALSFRTRVVGFSLSTLVVLLDQYTKHFVRTRLLPGETVTLTAWLNIRLVYNPGAAFSFLAEAGGWQHYLFLFIAIGMVIWVIRMMSQDHVSNHILLTISLALILGGTLGNFYDRLLYDGVVTDFIDLHWKHWHFATFNLADSALCLGAGLGWMISWPSHASSKRTA